MSSGSGGAGGVTSTEASRRSPLPTARPLPGNDVGVTEYSRRGALKVNILLRNILDVSQSISISMTPP